MNARLFTVFAVAASITLFVVSQLPPAVHSSHALPVPERNINPQVAHVGSITDKQNIQQPVTTVSSISPFSTTISEERPKLIGHIGGVPQAVFVRGNYAYVGYGPELAILDISNRARPLRIGYVVFPDLVLDINVADSYAYVADKSAGLRIVDVSNVAAPLEIGALDTPGECQSVEVVNNYAYIGDGISGLRIVNVSHPAHPAEVGVYDTPDEAKKVTVSNDFAYIADNQAGLWIVNITNPNAPSLVGSFDTRWYTTDVAVIGHYAYVLDRHSGLIILDVSNPGTPSVLGGYNPGQVSEKLTVVDHYAYVFETMNGLHVIDVANPHAPTQVGTYPLAEVYNGTVADGYAYLAQFYAGTLNILDVSNPHLPTKIGSYNSPGLLWGIAVDDAHIYTHDSTTLHVIDSTDPARLIPNGQLGSPLLPSWWPMPIDVQDHYLYVGDDLGLHVFDVTRPSNPAVLGHYNFGRVWDFDRVGNYLNVVSTDVFRIIDTSVPITLTQLGIYPVEGAWRIAGTGRYAYVMSDYGLHIVDILTPTAPSLTSIYTPSGYTVDVAEAKNFLYGLDVDQARLWIANVNNPVSPTLVSDLNMSGETWQINVVGNYAYVTDHYRLWIIDVSNPLTPTIAGVYAVQPQNTQSTAPIEPDIVGQYIYFADQFYGIFVLQFRSAIAGYVTDVNFRSIADVPIESNMLPTVTTNAGGVFAFAGVPTGTYSFTPTLDGYAFWPPSRTVTVPPDATNQNFVVLPAPVSMTLTPSMTMAVLQYTDTQGLITQLDFSANAVTQTATLILTPTVASPRAGFAFSGHAFDLTALSAENPQSFFTFNAPVTVTVHYSDDDVRLASDENELRLFWWNGTDWQDAAQTCEPAPLYTRVVALNMLKVPICHTGRFSLFSPTHQILLPINLRSWR